MEGVALAIRKVGVGRQLATFAGVTFLTVLGVACVSDRTNARASCGCAPCVCQIAKVTTTKDEKKSVSSNVLRKKDVCIKSKQFSMSKFISYFSVFIIVLVFQYLVFNSLYYFCF